MFDLGECIILFYFVFVVGQRILTNQLNNDVIKKGTMTFYP
jgi:hypothetical protein